VPLLLRHPEYFVDFENTSQRDLYDQTPILRLASWVNIVSYLGLNYVCAFSSAINAPGVEFIIFVFFVAISGASGVELFFVCCFTSYQASNSSVAVARFWVHPSSNALFLALWSLRERAPWQSFAT
jgi:hypothetical protein